MLNVRKYEFFPSISTTLPKNCMPSDMFLKILTPVHIHA